MCHNAEISQRDRRWRHVRLTDVRAKTNRRTSLPERFNCLVNNERPRIGSPQDEHRQAPEHRTRQHRSLNGGPDGLTWPGDRSVAGEAVGVGRSRPTQPPATSSETNPRQAKKPSESAHNGRLNQYCSRSRAAERLRGSNGASKNATRGGTAAWVAPSSIRF